MAWKALYESYFKRMTSTKVGKQLFEDYKKKFGRYPPRYIDLSDEEATKEIQRKLDTDK
ncbi:hypothetical protein [Listeria ilorinensis]|uniref:hypothetical protein n=1 Tax=Listeria ilorinensis TaxID=2867439 RepID=UPI001EF4B7AF|nr:hypothetical protein [Listeria ilorinensis]